MQESYYFEYISEKYSQTTDIFIMRRPTNYASSSNSDVAILAKYFLSLFLWGATIRHAHATNICRMILNKLYAIFLWCVLAQFQVLTMFIPLSKAIITKILISYSLMCVLYWMVKNICLDRGVMKVNRVLLFISIL